MAQRTKKKTKVLKYTKKDLAAKVVIPKVVWDTLITLATDVEEMRDFGGEVMPFLESNLDPKIYEEVFGFLQSFGAKVVAFDDANEDCMFYESAEDYVEPKPEKVAKTTKTRRHGLTDSES